MSEGILEANNFFEASQYTPMDDEWRQLTQVAASFGNFQVVIFMMLQKEKRKTYRKDRNALSAVRGSNVSFDFYSKDDVRLEISE